MNLNTIPHAVLPESWKEAMGLIEACPVHPSLIINSGYGMQAWWLFADDKAIAEAATAARMANAHKAVNSWFFEIGQRLGYRLDKSAWAPFSTLGKNYRLTIKEGHLQWGNLYIMLAVHPGVGKSPVLRPFQAPLVEKLNAEMPCYERALAEYRSTVKGIKAQQAAVEEKIRQSPKKAPDLVEELMRELVDMESSIPAEPTEPCFFLNDATSEAMARRMAGNDGFIGVLSSEGRKVLEQLHERGHLRRAMVQCVENRKAMEGYIVRPRHKLAQAAQEAA